MIEKIKEITNKILNSKWFVILIGIIIFLKTIFFYNNTISSVGKKEKQTILASYCRK